MKVLMLGWELPPHHTGGLGIVCYQMSKHLAGMGVDIEFILPYSADFDIDFMKVTPATPLGIDEILRAGGIYESSKFEIRYSDGTSELTDMRGQQDRYVDCVSRMVKLREFDIIHAHDWLTFRAGMAAKMVSGKPLIAHVHATEFDRSGNHYGNPVVHDIEYHGLMMADRILAVSQNTKDIIVREYGISPDRIDVVHNAIEMDPNYHIESGNVFEYLERMKAHGYKVVLSAGRITIQKGLTHLLQAAKKVIEVEPKTLFLFVGSGDQYHELIQMSADFGISENVLFTGFLNGTGKQWRDAFRVADLFVMPSLNEPFGIAPLEAINFGTPTLISKQSGVSEVLMNSLKVDFWDIDEMANKIVGVVSHDTLRDSLLWNSASEINSHSWHQSVEKMNGIYNEYAYGGAG